MLMFLPKGYLLLGFQCVSFACCFLENNQLKIINMPKRHILGKQILLPLKQIPEPVQGLCGSPGLLSSLGCDFGVAQWATPSPRAKCFDTESWPSTPQPHYVVKIKVFRKGFLVFRRSSDIYAHAYTSGNKDKPLQKGDYERNSQEKFVAVLSRHIFYSKGV